MEQGREFSARAEAGAMALQRRAWARGENGGFAQYVEVTGPDGIPVRLRLRGVSGGDETFKEPPKERRGSPLDTLIEFPPVLLLLLIVVPVVVLIRWLAGVVTRRPHWVAVIAAVGAAPGTEFVVVRAVEAVEARRLAAELADRVEREGASGVSCPEATPVACHAAVAG
jgi:hypothetical protein